MTLQKRYHLHILLVLFGVLGLRNADLHAQTETVEIYLRGSCSRDSLEKNWPEFRANSSQLSALAISRLQAWAEPCSILVFMGTWCSDSKREIPRFFQILDEIHNPNFTYNIIGLDRTKIDDAGLAEQNGVDLIPTFIFFRDGAEMGRIVEKPMVDLETDWLGILLGDPYWCLPADFLPALQMKLLGIWPLMGRP